ncbi:IPT/TIG domain-containing protein, partial [Candidatus Azambacteria bacterium]|nr:IPT/TIG domain-containing protein [Candidatus Azambacteria bacterium]
ANRNTHTQANDTQFSQIASSDNTRWTSADPGNGDEIFVWNEMTISENSAHIQQIDLTWEGFLTGGASATFSIWVLNASQAANWQNNVNWTQVGTTQSISGTSDTTMTRSITSNFSDYISGSGLLIWGVYESVSSESLNTDYVKADVTYRVTTLSNGTNPGNATVAPGSSVIDLDSFTLQTDVGSATVSNVTVALSAGSSGGVSSVAVTNDGGTTTYCSQSDPGSDTVALTSCAILVTTTQTQFKVRITPKSHANMPTPPGSTYSVTGTVSSITSADFQTAGADASSATITIDNASPANVTSASGSAGDGQVSLLWTNPGDSDFHSVVVLRRVSSAVADAPGEGVTYAVGNTIGSSVVACVEASPLMGCTDAGLDSGTAYHYKIFSRDNNNNYAIGVVPTGSPFTPSAPANSPPTLSISQPDGTDDTVTQGDSFNITYSLADTDNVVTAAFYYDSNNSGLDGTAISGACATAAEGTNATCSWDTTGVTPGSYYVYGITNDGVNSQVSAYSGGTITINAPAVISIDSVTPNAGALAGGTSVTIAGSNFQSGTAITFDGVSATDIVFFDSTSMTAKTPAHAAGMVDVTVTNTDLTTDTLVNGFTYTSAAVVHITASPLTVFTGESSVINWSTENATACQASDAWSGAKATSGNETVAPSASGTYTYALECSGAGGSGSGSVSILVTPPGAHKEPGVLFRFDGFAYPDGKIFLYDNSAPFSQLVSDLSGRFATSFRLIDIAEKHLFSIIAYDKEGNVSPSKTFPSELYARGGLTDVLIAPTIILNKRSLTSRESLRIFGYATPGNKVQVEIDGKVVGTVLTTASGYYTLSAPLSALARGDHTARSMQAATLSRTSDHSLLKAFQIADPFVANADLNNDGKLTISDWSIFLSIWSSRDASIKNKIDLNGDGRVTIADLSVFLSSFRKK